MGFSDLSRSSVSIGPIHKALEKKQGSCSSHMLARGQPALAGSVLWLCGSWVNGIRSILDMQKEEIDSLEKETWSRQNEPWQRAGGPRVWRDWGKLEDEEEIVARQSTESGNATGKGCKGFHFSLSLHIFLRSLRTLVLTQKAFPYLTDWQFNFGRRNDPWLKQNTDIHVPANAFSISYSHAGPTDLEIFSDLCQSTKKVKSSTGTLH
ncbi:uncharacterized protein LOC130601752 [Pezoporus wallicus]|uniref:uncharacterized protein LOC130601752 n=1 Tax=Pezoporus wallicus TaxID=35540 RepID=UPI00254C94F4|nr:uncharacterized protein LOC130601752 [Pezoporus wallicus]